MKFRVVAFIAVTLAAQAAFAGTVLITSRGALSNSDTLSIATFGADGSNVASGTTVASMNGNMVTVSDGGTNGFSVLQEANEWSGNFANNELVLWTGDINSGNSDPGPITFAFSNAVGAIGFQVQPDDTSVSGVPFIASISAFDAGNNPLGTFTENGTSNFANDGSAIFIGEQSSSANISSIQVNITSPSGIDFALNYLTFGAPSTTTATPEPSSLALALCAAGFLPLALRRRIRN
jgi:hypothetical protein